jgi:hypothetical protein
LHRDLGVDHLGREHPALVGIHECDALQPHFAPEVGPELRHLDATRRRLNLGEQPREKPVVSGLRAQPEPGETAEEDPRRHRPGQEPEEEPKEAPREPATARHQKASPMPKWKA